MDVIARMWKEEGGYERWRCIVETSRICFSASWPFFSTVKVQQEFIRKSEHWVSADNPDEVLGETLSYQAEELSRILESVGVTPVTNDKVKELINAAGARTGRLDSSSPNKANVPKTDTHKEGTQGPNGDDNT